MTKLTVIGCGYLGAVHAACMAQLGHEVTGIDVDVPKVELLASGRTPFFEPGFEEVLQAALASGRLSFTTDMAAARGATVHFVCVGTPQKRNEYAADLAYVDAESYDVDPAKADGFAASVRRFWPGLPDGALTPAYAGIRPKLHGPGEPQPDFRIDGPDAHGLEGLVAMFGIESPGLTSSLAIGEVVAARLVD